MKYAIIGAGGTGGCLGFFLKKAGKDVTLIARGKHLEAIRKNGLTIQKLWDESRETLPVKAFSPEKSGSDRYPGAERGCAETFH